MSARQIPLTTRQTPARDWLSNFLNHGALSDPRYNDEGSYGPHINRVLDYLSKVLKAENMNNKVIWIETFRQHFRPRFNTAGEVNKQNGYFGHEPGFETNDAQRAPLLEKAETIHSPGCCAPISNLSSAADWRNRVVRDVLLSHPDKFDGLTYVPMAKLTVPLDSMHVCNTFNVDCTHYCYMPLLWSPVWRALLDAVKPV